MNTKTWKLTALVAAAAALGALAGGARHLAAETAAPKPSRQTVARSPASGAETLSAQTLRRKVGALQSRGYRGIYLLFRYDPILTKQLDLDDNGLFTDTGDRTILQGVFWRSDQNAAQHTLLGRFSSVFDYLDPSGQETGTDLINTVDLYFIDGGQVRAGGFWSVADGVGEPALGIASTTGAPGLRRYYRGQLIFLGTVVDGEELYFLAR